MLINTLMGFSQRQLDRGGEGASTYSKRSVSLDIKRPSGHQAKRWFHLDPKHPPTHLKHLPPPVLPYKAEPNNISRATLCSPHESPQSFSVNWILSPQLSSWPKRTAWKNKTGLAPFCGTSLDGYCCNILGGREDSVVRAHTHTHTHTHTHGKHNRPMTRLERRGCSVGRVRLERS